MVVAKKSILAKMVLHTNFQLSSSAEVANAKHLHAFGYSKSLLDEVTAECTSAVLEAAEKRDNLLA